jgi:hypothetical protein
MENLAQQKHEFAWKQQQFQMKMMEDKLAMFKTLQQLLQKPQIYNQEVLTPLKFSAAPLAIMSTALAHVHPHYHVPASSIL